MIVDCHVHLFPPEIQADRRRACESDAHFAALYADPRTPIATSDDLLQTMNEDGIDVAVAVGFGWLDREQCRRSNDYLLESADRSSMRLVPFVNVVPSDVEWSLAEIDRCRAAGARGIGELMPDGQKIDLNDPDGVRSIFDRATTLEMVVMIHASEPVGHQYAGKGTAYPRTLLGLVQNFPETRFILAHLGGGLAFYGFMPEVAEELRRHVWFDLAATPFLYRSEAVVAAAEAVGWDRLLFATDYPLIRPKRLLGDLARVGADRADVLGGNAQALLGL